MSRIYERMENFQKRLRVALGPRRTYFFFKALKNRKHSGDIDHQQIRSITDKFNINTYFPQAQ